MIGAVVLAAGLSCRMGTQKMLLPFGGRTVIGHIVDELLHSRVDEVYVVVGHEGDRVAAELAGRNVCVVRNPDYESGGMLSSVRCGVRALPPGCAAALVALGDQPGLTAGLVDRMIHSFEGDCPQSLQADRAAPGRGGLPIHGQGILVPCHQGRRGHPLLIAARLHHDILTRYDDVGLRGLLQSHPEEVCELDVPTAAVLSDMDCPADYQRELARFESQGGGP